jgi:hypothetical protein
METWVQGDQIPFLAHLEVAEVVDQQVPRLIAFWKTKKDKKKLVKTRLLREATNQHFASEWLYHLNVSMDLPFAVQESEAWECPVADARKHAFIAAPTSVHDVLQRAPIHVLHHEADAALLGGMRREGMKGRAQIQGCHHETHNTMREKKKKKRWKTAELKILWGISTREAIGRRAKAERGPTLGSMNAS